MLFSIVVLGVCAGCWEEQSAKKHPVIGIVNLTPWLDPFIDGFKEGMATYGYREGKNVTYVYQGALENKEQLDGALHYLLDQDIDLLFVPTTAATKKAKQVMGKSGVPIVFAPVLLPQESGIVDTLSRPGGMVTGVRVGGSAARVLGWFSSIVPMTLRNGREEARGRLAFLWLTTKSCSYG